jgi:hypothetical protein
MKPKPTFECKNCGLTVTRRRIAQRYCGVACRMAAHRGKTAARELRSVTEGGDTKKRNSSFLKTVVNHEVTGSQKHGRGSHFNAPLNVLGGDRWTGRKGLDQGLLATIIRAEIGGAVRAVPEQPA